MGNSHKSIGIIQQCNRRMSHADTEIPDLKGLLTSLASFAKAAQSLPTGDALEFESSFPEFQLSLGKVQESLLDILQGTITHLNAQDESHCLEETLAELDVCSLEDPVLWEKAADACDALVEQVEAYLQRHSVTTSDVVAPLRHFSQQANAVGGSKLSRLVNNAVDLPKPQDIYNIKTHSESRTSPFVPKAHQEKPNAKTPLDLSLVPGHGHDSRYGSLRKTPKSSEEIIAPSHHCAHIYEHEIQSFSYSKSQLTAHQPGTTIITQMNALEAEWIDSEESLEALAKRLSSVKDMAIDLEAHSYRAFAGIVCLMQISIRVEDTDSMENYLVDTLKLHHCLNLHLADCFSNPAIVKVLHGADQDIQWLQRDFGLYIVNLFDTGRAARTLNFPAAGYAYLLSRYCNITADKSHQLADWRQRPLSQDMQQYAIQDTHYLLDIYERLKWDLSQQSEFAIREVFDISRQISLIRFAPEPFYPRGYRKLLRQRGRRNDELQPLQEAVLEALWDWRDQTARQHDESALYICSNQNLLRMALASTSTMSTTQLQALFNPIPPFVLRYSQQILDLIKQSIQNAAPAHTTKLQSVQVNDFAGAGEEDENKDDSEISVNTSRVGAPSSAFFKPANVETDQKHRGLMSPVLGTEALYKQAGWMTPLDYVGQGTESGGQVAVDDTEVTTTTADDDDDDDASGKPKKLLSVNASNHDYQSRDEDGPSTNRSRSVDGMGSVRTSLLAGVKPEEFKEARANASRIKSGMVLQKNSIPAILGLLGSGAPEGDTEIKDAKGIPSSRNDHPDDGGVGLEQDFRIPRSIREIYMVSNRNRRNKKAGTPTPERGVTPTSEKEREELAAAEALLKERGVQYFDMDASPEKRARTKSSSSAKSEESIQDQSQNIPSKEDDLAFMKEIGWIKSSEEVEGLIKHREGRNRGSGFDGQPGEGNDPPTAMVGIYNPGRPNPFFSGATLHGGPLAQQGLAAGKSDNSKKSSNSGKAKQNRNRQERPEKKDSRTHSYRKR